MIQTKPDMSYRDLIRWCQDVVDGRIEASPADKLRAKELLTSDPTGIKQWMNPDGQNIRIQS